MRKKIVYGGRYNDYDAEGHLVPRKFTFLGYDFLNQEGTKGRLSIHLQ